jgi:hypothetical protein
MHRKCGVIFCENEHGCGDVTFPDLDAMSIFDLQQRFIEAPSERQTRQEARAAGWGRVNKADYCAQCMENM